MAKDKFTVSENFMEIYRNFNVCDQIEKMKNLSEKELYLLLTLCIDKHDDENIIVKHNFVEFEKEIMEIFEIQDDKKTTNKVLLELIDETGDNYIETDYIVDSTGGKVPDTFSKEEVRDIKLGMISGEEK